MNLRAHVGKATVGLPDIERIDGTANEKKEVWLHGRKKELRKVGDGRMN